MNRARLAGWGLWLCLPLFTTLNQIAMKLAAGALKEESFGTAWLAQAAGCPYIWMSMACEAVNFAVWLAILKRHALSRAFPLTSLSYAAMMAVSWLGFGEAIRWQQLAGVAIILAGVALMGES